MLLLACDLPNAAIYGRSVVAAFVRFFAQKVTAHGVPQDGFVSFFGHRFSPLSWAIQFLEHTDKALCCPLSLTGTLKTQRNC